MSYSEPKNNLHPYLAEKTSVIHTRGTEKEIGRQHVEQLGQKVTLGMAPFYHRFFKRALNPSGLGTWEGTGLKVISKLIDPFLVWKLSAQIPPSFLERIHAVAEASRIKHDVFLTALVLPDLLPMLQAQLIRLNPNRGIDVTVPPKFGCSSFVAKGKHFLHGRNLDFPGVAYWDRFPVLQLVEPRVGYRYLGITTAGVPLAGISGVNEAQISISLHQHYSLQTNWNGNLPFIISEKVLSEANSIERALEIIKEAKVSSAWAFIVTDGKTRDGFVFEKHPKGGGVRWLADNGDLLTHTNFFQSQECRGTDYATTERMNWDNFWRNETLQRRIRPKLAELTPELAVQYLSDHYDGFWQEEKVVNRTVSQVYNIQSYVLDPVEFKLLLAEGDCPIHMGEYREYDLGEIFSGKKGQTSRNFLPYQFQSNAKASAKRDYILSFVAAFDDDFEKALVRLENSLEHSFSSEAALVAALINVRLQGSLEKSFQYLDRGAIEIEKKVREKSLDYFPPEYFEVLLYQARLCDLMGKREKAVRIYQQITHHSSLSDRNIRSLAQKARPYKKNRINRILMPYSSYIPFD